MKNENVLFFKALRHLIIYAVLMNRHQLAKVLWKRSSEPIPLALICCMMFKKLAPYCHESYQRLLIEKQAKFDRKLEYFLLEQLCV